jgi:hypothetical protein
MECFQEMRDSFKSLEEKVDKLLSSNDSFQSTQVRNLQPETDNPPSPEVYEGVELTSLKCSATSP